MVERRLIAVQGVVQGVGFRPYVHRLASESGLFGSVWNGPDGVTIDVEGDSHRLDAFLRRLTLDAPPLASIARVDVGSAAPRACRAFSILPSETGVDAAPSSPPLPADIATCDACRREMLDPANRRFRHPFITCTACGPRLTIARGMPYDRERTAMAAFEMCAECRREYRDPGDRRFHAQTIACPACGPALTTVHRRDDPTPFLNGDALDAATDALRAGRIVAMKALGGFHLACDATAETAVARLRARKRRAAKPFALMVRDLAMARALCLVSEPERALLESVARPIVLLERRAGAAVAPSVAPSQRTLGVMLPSTPLHHLVLDALDRPLVMTSGNRSDEPVVIDEADAFAALGEVADLFMVHDRPIQVRCDDSVARVVAGDVRVIRRSRGYAPGTVALGVCAPVPVLALGGHLKNAVCLAHGSRAMLSPHVGDLDSWESRRALRSAIDATVRFAGVQPQVIAHDLHPEYASTLVAHEIATERQIRRTVPVQHHHAHVAAGAAEHGHAGPVIGVVFDGAGLGTDGAIWGGEFLLATGASFSRCGHLAYVPLPGGDAAARRPWSMAAAHLASAGLPGTRPEVLAEREWDIVQQLLTRPRAIPRTSSVGRLFDAVASLLGVCHVSRFEGDAAMALEAVADVRGARAYEVTFTGDFPFEADPGAIVRAVVEDRERGRSVAEVAGAFHRTLRDLVVAGCARIREATGVATVVLTGGVFMNAALLSAAHVALASRGFRVLIPGMVPCNDGGIALGQARVAAHALLEDACA